MLRERRHFQGTELPFRLMTKYKLTNIMPQKLHVTFIYKHSFTFHRIPAVIRRKY